MNTHSQGRTLGGLMNGLRDDGGGRPRPASCLRAWPARKALAAALLAFAFPLSVRGEDPPPGSPTDGPRLVVSASRWDLGKVAPGRYQQAFEITNAGAAALVVDEVRVSNPDLMSATVLPLGTEPGRRYQLTVVVSTSGIGAPFSGYVILHSNDPACPNVRIDVAAEPGGAADDRLLVFHAEQGPEADRIREVLVKAAKDLPFEMLSSGDLAHVDRLRALERQHGLKNGGRFEMFRGRESFVCATEAEALAAIDRLQAGAPLAGSPAPLHRHEAAGKSAAVTAELLPPPVVVDFFVTPSCEQCGRDFKTGADALLKRFGNRLGVRVRDVTQPDAARVLMESLPEKDRPPAVHAVAVVAGAAYASGDVAAIFQELPKLVDAAAARADRELSLRSAHFATDLRMPAGSTGPGGGPRPPAPIAAAASAAGDSWIPWLLGACLLLNLFTLLRTFSPPRAVPAAAGGGPGTGEPAS